MVIFAAAIKILASACEDLSALDWDELAKGLIGVGVLLTEVSLFMPNLAVKPLQQLQELLFLPLL